MFGRKKLTFINVIISVFDLAYSADGQQLVVAAGSRVYVYNTTDWSLVQALKVTYHLHNLK